MSATTKIRCVDVPFEFVRDLGSHDQYALDLSFHGGPKRALVAVGPTVGILAVRLSQLAETYLPPPAPPLVLLPPERDVHPTDRVWSQEELRRHG
jgi:hypothetical protein